MLKADDGDGHTDTVTVEIVTAAPPRSVIKTVHGTNGFFP